MDSFTCERVVLATLGLLVEMLEDVRDHLAHAFRCEERILLVDRSHLFVIKRFGRLDRAHIINAERQNVLIGDRIDNRVGVQFLAEGLLGRAELRVTSRTSVRSEDRCPRETEQVISLEGLGDRGTHVAEL